MKGLSHPPVAWLERLRAFAAAVSEAISVVKVPVDKFFRFLEWLLLRFGILAGVTWFIYQYLRHHF